MLIVQLSFSQNGPQNSIRLQIEGKDTVVIVPISVIRSLNIMNEEFKLNKLNLSTCDSLFKYSTITYKKTIDKQGEQLKSFEKLSLVNDSIQEEQNNQIDLYIEKVDILEDKLSKTKIIKIIGIGTGFIGGVILTSKLSN